MQSALMRRTYTRREVAVLLEVHPQTVTRMVAAGKLPGPLNLPHTYPRWDADEIDRLLGIAA